MFKKRTLTKAQQEQLRAFRHQWFEISTSTERADRQKAEAAIIQMREEIGVTTSPIVLWCQSPATGLLTLELLKSPAEKKEVVPPCQGAASLRASLRDSLRGSLQACPGGSLGESLAEAWGGPA